VSAAVAALVAAALLDLSPAAPALRDAHAEAEQLLESAVESGAEYLWSEFLCVFVADELFCRCSSGKQSVAAELLSICSFFCGGNVYVWICSVFCSVRAPFALRIVAYLIFFVCSDCPWTLTHL